MLILDEQGNAAPPGQVGEIAVRSRYLASGYWQRPELTQAAFVAVAQSTEESGLPPLRLYRTGDLGCMAADGRLDYLGRKDFHAKVRGAFVEIAALESALLALGHPEKLFERAVAVTRRDSCEGGEESRLIAYLVPAVARELLPDARSLRRALRQTLPVESIPAEFVLLERLPITPDGKFDRLALPSPGPENVVSNGMSPSALPDALPDTSACTPIEKSIAHMWAEVLPPDQADRIGVYDDFFDLAGNSLHAAQILTRIRDALGVDVPMQSFFAAPTVAGLAAYVIEHLPIDGISAYS